jgi:hypothetical protein
MYSQDFSPYESDGAMERTSLFKVISTFVNNVKDIKHVYYNIFTRFFTL